METVESIEFGKTFQPVNDKGIYVKDAASLQAIRLPRGSTAVPVTRLLPLPSEAVTLLPHTEVEEVTANDKGKIKDAMYQSEDMQKVRQTIEQLDRQMSRMMYFFIPALLVAVTVAFVAGKNSDIPDWTVVGIFVILFVWLLIIDIQFRRRIK